MREILVSMRLTDSLSVISQPVSSDRPPSVSARLPNRRREGMASWSSRRASLMMSSLSSVEDRRLGFLIMMMFSLASAQHGEQGARHQRHHHDMHDDEQHQKTHREEMYDARIVKTAHQVAQQRQLHRFPDRQAGHHNQNEIGNDGQIRQFLHRVIVIERRVLQLAFQRLHKVMQHFLRTQWKELTLCTSA